MKHNSTAPQKRLNQVPAPAPAPSQSVPPSGDAVGEEPIATGRVVSAPDSAPPARELRTDGPTLEEYVKAGYKAENYPPTGYAPRESAPPEGAEEKPSCDGKPTRAGSLCGLVGCTTWVPKTSPGGQWRYHECANELCGRIVDAKPV